MNMPNIDAASRNAQLRKVYWAIRAGVATIWIWTAVVSWFVFPRDLSMAWLQKLGLHLQLPLVLAWACLFDLALGAASLLLPSRALWRFQFAVVAGYSVVVAWWLPEFLFHPFGPLSKNLAVLGCLAFLAVVERR